MMGLFQIKKNIRKIELTNCIGVSGTHSRSSTRGI